MFEFHIQNYQLGECHVYYYYYLLLTSNLEKFYIYNDFCKKKNIEKYRKMHLKN
jgi:hypothetical protein